MELKELLVLALQEDVGDGDITTLATVNPDQKGKAKVIAKQAGILCGIDIFASVFNLIDQGIVISKLKKDGERLDKGDVVVSLQGSLGAILQGERVALNLLGQLSGIATKTRKFVDLISSSKIQILDTRKTLPLWRRLQKYAVKTGGGANHRFGLYDMILIKENHIEAAGSLEKAIERAIEFRRKHDKKLKIEIEVKNVNEFKRALNYPIDIVMLDNMEPDEIRKAVELNRDRVKLEVSGGIDETNISHYASLGLDYISIGALTHSLTNFDFSLLIKQGN